MKGKAVAGGLCRPAVKVFHNFFNFLYDYLCIGLIKTCFAKALIIPICVVRFCHFATDIPIRNTAKVTVYVFSVNYEMAIAVCVNICFKQNVSFKKIIHNYFFQCFLAVSIIVSMFGCCFFSSSNLANACRRSVPGYVLSSTFSGVAFSRS